MTPAPTWILAAGGVSEERREVVSVFNPTDRPVRFSINTLDDGKTLAIESLQDVEIAAGGFRTIHVHDHVELESLPLVITAAVDTLVFYPHKT